MRKRIGSFSGLLCVVLLFGALFPSVAWANAAAPPSMVIIVYGCPDDLELTLVGEYMGETRTEHGDLSKTLLYESFFRFIDRFDDASLTVTTGGQSFSIDIPAQELDHYYPLFTLDLDTHTLIPDERIGFTILATVLRLVLTLALEGLLFFFVFRYREKRSWLLFLAINVITQLGLDVMLLTPRLIMSSYPLIEFFLAEVAICLIECLVLVVLVKEHSKKRTAAFVFCANLLSLVVGGYFLSLLPV
jgi:hypothetical protein